MKQYIKVCILGITTFFQVALPTISLWDWSTINLDDIVLPQIRGVGTSAYQIYGQQECPDSNWAAWESKKVHNGYRTIEHDDFSRDACNGWHHCFEDINLIKELGCNSYRFSIEWSKIEPTEGEFCQEAIDHYVAFAKALVAAGIEPMITLHHFTHPQWFEDRGGFENEDNIHYFVRFCTRMFNALSDDVKLWCTINEIGPFVFQGYINGAFPPGKHSFLSAFKVMRTMLKAHCDVYRALKQLPHGNECKIGLVHAYLAIEPYSSLRKTMLTSAVSLALLGYMQALMSEHYTPDASLQSALQYTAGVAALGAGLNVLEQAPAYVMDYIFNGAMLNFLKTGTLFPYIPYLRTTIEDAPSCYDFIGINVYSRVVIRSRVLDALVTRDFNDVVYPTCREGEIMTDMQYGICPEALYESIKAMSTLKVPLYITENGISDAYDDRRPLFIKRYLYALSKAIKDGYDVRGYYYWSLMDNFEWNEGYAKKFGLYAVDMNTKERTMKKSAQLYRDAITTAPLPITSAS